MVNSELKTLNLKMKPDTNMKMKRIPLLTVAVSVTVLSVLTSCDDFYLGCLDGNGIAGYEERNLSHYTGLISEGEYDVFIIMDSVSKVRIEADENLIPYIRTVVKDDILVIDNGSRRCLRNRNNEPIRIYVHTTDIFYIELDGSGIIYSDYLIYVDYLKVELDGSGIIDLRDIDALELDARLSGSGEIELWGIAGTGDFDIPGSGIIKAFHLEQDECYASISGSGDMYVFVYDFLDANISGSGNIFYRGNPRINVRITGSGSLNNNN
jgi:hypothetical protein